MSHGSTHFVLILLIAVAVPCSSQIRGRIDVSTEGIWSEKPLVAVTATKDQVCLTALALTQRIRLEVLSQTGEPIYDSDFRPGNRLEWEIKDQHGSEMRDGTYGCIVTVVDLNGQTGHRHGSFKVTRGAVSFESPKRELAAAWDEQQDLKILGAEEPSPFTLVSHDGEEGRIESASGGLSFYAGSVSHSRDAASYLRLTPEGKLGVGVEEPQAKLEVAGLIRASDGFQFSDGTVLKMENGFPMLVSERSYGTVGGSASSAGKTTRMLVTGNGSPGRVLSNEIGSNTWFGEGTGASIIAATQNSFFGYNAGNHTDGTPPDGSYNSFFGASAGYNNTTGHHNSFFGNSAGYSNTTGFWNSFFGYYAGAANTTGTDNTFVGTYAGLNNTTGGSNSLYGYGAGINNNIGASNSLFGMYAGYSNTSGSDNSFFGLQAGYSNTIGPGNSFFGLLAGGSNTTGAHNTFVGYLAGLNNTTEDKNSFIGAYSNGLAGITNATAVGANAVVSQSNSLVLGSISGQNMATVDTNVGIGVTAPKHRLHVESSFPNPAAGGRATYSYTSFTPASNNSGYIFGLESAARYTGQYNLTANHLAPGYALSALSGYYGGTVATGHGGAGSVGTVTGVTAQNLMRDSVTIDHAIGVQIQPAIADVGSATVGSVYGVYVKNPYNVTPTNVYGLYVDSLTEGTNRYALYTAGTSKSHFGGDVEIAGNILYSVGGQNPPDYVFDPGYKLMTFEELARFIAEKKHLPNVPSAAEMKEKGLNLGEFQMKLLEKIEELTLYTVQQAKAIQAQRRDHEAAIKQKEAEIALLKSHNSSLDARLAALEQMMAQLTEREK